MNKNTKHDVYIPKMIRYDKNTKKIEESPCTNNGFQTHFWRTPLLMMMMNISMERVDSYSSW